MDIVEFATVPGSAEPLTPEQTVTRLQELRDWGVDLSLVESSIAKTPTERILAMLDMSEFIEALQQGCRSTLELANADGQSPPDQPMNQGYSQLFQRLAQENAAAVVIGEVAAAAFGASIALTIEAALCYDPEPANLARLARALGPFNLRLRVEGMTDREAAALPFQLDAHTLSASTILTLQTDVGALDLMSSVAGVGSYAEVGAGAIEVEVLGFRMLILDLPALLASKRAAGRPKDLFALPQIEAALRQRQKHTPID